MKSPARYVPVHLARGTPHVMLDSLPVPGSVLTLSHWPGAVNPIRIESDTSTGIVLDFLGQGGSLADVGACTAVHFDIDGLLALHVALGRSAGYDASPVRDLARAGDFGTATTARARRGVFALDAATVAAGAGIGLAPGARRTAATYQRMLGWLGEHFEALHAGTLAPSWWAAGERHYERSARLLDSADAPSPRFGTDEMSAVELPADDRPWPARLYFGLDPFAVHERCPALAVLVSRGGQHQLVQRYEGWVQGHDPAWARRRDLAPLRDYLHARDPEAGWRYAGVYHPFARLETGAGRASALSTETLRGLVSRFHATTAPGWHPLLID